MFKNISWSNAVIQALNCGNAPVVPPNLRRAEGCEGEDIIMADTSRLPGPVADIWEWQYEGACRTSDPSIFFHPEGERGPSRERRDHTAKAICATCPVRKPCAQHALSVREPYGVWGGLTEDERDQIIARGRPLKLVS